MSFIASFTKVASFGDNHTDGTQFDGASQSIDPVMYNVPKDSPDGKKPKDGKKALALNIATGVYKLSAQLDDTAKGVSEGLDKEYNGTDPARNQDDADEQKQFYLRHLKAKKRGK